MKNLAKVFLLLLGASFLTGCPVNGRLSNEEEDDQQQQIRQQVAEIQKRKAEDTAQIGEVQNDMRSISGRIEDVEHQMRQGNTSLKAEMDELRQQVQAQNEKIRLLDEHITASEQKLLAAMQTNLGAPSSSHVSSAPTAHLEKPKSEKKEKRREREAEAKPVSDEGSFDEAESLFSGKEFKKAIVKYESYRERNPKGSRVAEATYKIGVSFEELGMRKDAKDFYLEVVDKHPGSKSAKKAKFRLTQMK